MHCVKAACGTTAITFDALFGARETYHGSHSVPCLEQV